MSEEELGESGEIANPNPIDSKEGQLNPFFWYEEMRESNPVYYDEQHNCWHVFRYEHVNRVVSDYEAFTSSKTSIFERMRKNSSIELGKTLVNSDPPKHTNLRSPANDFFTPGNLRDEFSSRLEELTEELLGDFEDGEELDFVADFAVPFPITIIAEIMDVPIGDRDKFRQWSYGFHTPPKDETLEAIEEAHQKQFEAYQNMAEYLSEVIDQRKNNLGNDIISVFIQSDQIKDKEVLAICTELLQAGNITTTNLLANAIWVFKEHKIIPDIQKGRISLDQAIEEALRYRSPVTSLSRSTTEQVDLGGKTIPEGEFVLSWLASANRDGKIFDNPETFNPRRKPNKHMAFGRGIHTCLGAPLATLEAEVALSTLLKKVENIEITADELEPIRARPLHGVKKLPIEVRM